MVWDGPVGFACGNWLALALHKWWIYFSWWFSFGWLVFSVFQPPNMGFIVDLAAKMRVSSGCFQRSFLQWSGGDLVQLSSWSSRGKNHEITLLFLNKTIWKSRCFSELNPMEIILFYPFSMFNHRKTPLVGGLVAMNFIFPEILGC